MRKVNRYPRRDPAPSRLRYRLTRIWLRPWCRRTVNVGIPIAVGLLALTTLLAEVDVKGRTTAAWRSLREKVVDQPQFTITRIEVPDVSTDLAEQIRVSAFVELPASSLEVSAATVRGRVESLDAVERARVQVRSNGVLEIRAVERIPVVVWRGERGLQLLDRTGIRVAEIDSRLRRPDLPLIAGAGADAHVPEALMLFDGARPVLDRVRGLVRVGQRRWDLVLDRGQTIRLPEEDPASALRRVMALDAAEELLERDLVAVDMRDSRRPMVRMTEHAATELKRLKSLSAGEDA
jgi:cell division protein FtsQ